MIDVSPAPRPAGPTGVRRVADRALTVAAALGGLSLVAALVFAVAGITPLIFTSGSMSPEIPTGSLALARSVPVDDLVAGDVVSVLDGAGTRVTHRVVSVDDAGLVLKGDANLSADAGVYDVEAADRVLVSVPHAGTALAAVTGPVGRGVLLGIAAVVLLALVRSRSGSRPARAEAIAVLAALATVAGVGVGVARAPEGTSAFWTDSVVGTSTISVYQPPQFDVGCANQWLFLYYVDLSWSPVSGATGYTVTITRSGTTTPVDTLTSPATRLTVSTTNVSDLRVPTGNSTYDVNVTAKNAAGAVVANSRVTQVRVQGNSTFCD